MANEKLVTQIEALVLKRIAEDKLVLPTMPAVVVKCLELLRNPDFSFKEVSSLLEQDPTLAARALKVATSAAYGGGAGVKITLTEALSRLGTKELKTLLVEASAQKVFVSKNARIAEAARGMWEHSVAVAVLARDIAALTGSSEPEVAYLAGLLHDIGKPIVATLLLEAERQITELHGGRWIDSAEWIEVVKLTHRKVGVAVAEGWRLPENICRCIRDCSEFDASNRSSIVNAVCFGNALAKQTGIVVGPVDRDDVNALVMIGRSLIGIGDDIVQNLTASLRDRVIKLYK